ncbi:lipid-A-disaccharide synthase [Schlesneria paludicola]|uniref:lipid-A-disaccharide synthase n=1 Tax=Schlesneria paludicola TaxID=360056 RepID=UPI0002F447DB|nr:lipid-A-disaccharide synthase [Schlesneria paludicola]
MMHIFFSVGEPSGDQHAAHLIRELNRRRSDLRISGFGGSSMEQAGCHLLFPLTTMAVMGVFAVLPLIWKFYKLVKRAEAYFDQHKPDLVVLVDFPGFNWWIARKAKARGIPVVYYMPPQLWAWGSWRIKRVRKYVDLVLSGLNFETEWYAERGIPVMYVGHPFFDEVADHKLDDSFCREWGNGDLKTVAILPGSRKQELNRCWPVMLSAIQRLHERFPDVNFLVANYKETQRQFCIQEYEKLQQVLPVSFFVGKTPEIIQIADCAVNVSGSVSLEMLARGTPYVTIYRSSWATYLIGQMVIVCKYFSLPNLIAGRMMMPEHFNVGNPQPMINAIVSDISKWLENPAALAKATTELKDLRNKIHSTGATRRTAELILSWMDNKPESVERSIAA